MTARKRRAPERKKRPSKEPGLLWQILAVPGRAVARYPRSVAGLLCVSVAFSFVAANALWYQPENHPAPFLRTRDQHDPNAIAGFRPLPRQNDDVVTTFRIERARSDDAVRQLISGDEPAEKLAAGAPAADPVRELIAQPAQTAAPSAPHAPQPEVEQVEAPPAVAHVAVPIQRPSGNLAGEDPVAAAIRTAQHQPAPRPPADIPAVSKANKAAQATPQPTRVSAQPGTTTPQAIGAAAGNANVSDSMNLIMQIQRGLVNIAYTDVTVDGVAGSQTKAAIRHFQKHYRLPENGEPSELVLRKLKSIGAL
ncbi:peptidoglycan-binding protein [Rhizobium helianthi]|uniref:Peptidoglycan-binding protein n=1 Tax=Rhizobium helianthi TaxID=1132695 RepID=A0ABW4M6K0_9HYPH